MYEVEKKMIMLCDLCAQKSFLLILNKFCSLTGFHLSGEVAPAPPPSPLPSGYTFMEEDKTYKVSLSFDR